MGFDCNLRIDLSPEDTLDTVATKLEAAEEAERQARIRGAKTALGQLVAAGVVSYDDGYGEMVASHLHEAQVKRAAAAGVSLAEQRATEAAYQRTWDARSYLDQIVTEGEAQWERKVRFDAIKAAAPRGMRTLASGRQVSCPHGHGRHSWWQVYTMAIRDSEGIPVDYDDFLVCDKCGVRVEEPVSKLRTPPTRSELSKTARTILCRAPLAAYTVSCKGGSKWVGVAPTGDDALSKAVLELYKPQGSWWLLHKYRDTDYASLFDVTEKLYQEVSAGS